MFHILISYADEAEHQRILACLVVLQAEMNAPTRPGGSKCGLSTNKNGQMAMVHVMLFNDYLLTTQDMMRFNFGGA
jgi:hypothetical protein